MQKEQGHTIDRSKSDFLRFSQSFLLNVSPQVFLDGNVPTGEDPLANHHAVSEVDPGAEAGPSNGWGRRSRASISV